MLEKFLERLYREYQIYRKSLLSCPKFEIINRCYEIDSVVNFYEILLEKAEGMSDSELEAVLEHKNILMELYALWLDKSDSTYSEMKEHVDEEIQYIMEKSKKEVINQETLHLFGSRQEIQE